MTIIWPLVLLTTAVTNSPESKSFAQAEKKSTCGIRRLEASDMMLTCYFYDNISALQKDFTVYLYKGEQSPKTVLSCEWSPEIVCHVAPGYEYLYDIDANHDHINVRIPNAGAEHAGMYTCQVIGESDPGTCILTEEPSPQNSPLTPHTQLTFTTLPAQTATTTSLLPDDRQTQSVDERSSAASKLSTPKDTPSEQLTEEDKQTGSQDNTVVHVVPSVVVSVLVIIAIAVIIALCRKRRNSRTGNERSGTKPTADEMTLLNKRQQDEPHSDISPPKPEDCQTTDGQLAVREEDKQQKPSFTENPRDTEEKAAVARDDNLINRQEQTSHSVPRHSGDTTCCSPPGSSVESAGQQGPELQTRCKEYGDSCLEADTKPLMSESSELVEKTGIQERGDVDAENDETRFDDKQPELHQRNSHIDAPKKVNREEEEDSPVTESALTTGHVKVRAV